MENLTPPGVEQSRAYAINNAGEVVGEAKNSAYGWRCFHWTRKSGMRVLEEMLVNLPSKVYLSSVNDINKRGEIVGTTYGDYDHAFLLSPIGGGLPQLNLLLLD